VSHFFVNGGQQAYIVRLVASRSDGAEDTDARGHVLRPNESEFESALLADGGGINVLDHVDLFNLLCVPGETTASVISNLQRFCRDRRAFLIVDCERNANVEDLLNGPLGITDEGASNSAFYFPWVVAPDPLAGQRPRPFPPCGFVAGVYARTDSARGVWKAPAGLEASLSGVTGTATELNDRANGVLNPKAINCIRDFARHGTVIWGARTLAGNDARVSDWKYVPVRRTALYIEESLQRGLKWVVFEPNAEPLWERIRLSVGAFMQGLFRQGAFQGASSREAFFVKCDHETTTQDDIDKGTVVFVVGFAPLKPREFVIMHFAQTAGAPA
jgi:hypothetical protein